ncbi:Uncharacterized protein OBRU01_24662 [Operophtera brumata]|uniref:Uncharacterized protein n=1 Tax=Operophtera brumata TaxID=104452 RepID=A0A0L7KKY7_OPEBR|nr:Uncharacterized protein OBRU01_24662 [Operophtera brumata]
MQCGVCGANLNDGVQCGTFSKHLDFGSAQISEAGWSKLGSDRRNAWKCSSCRNHSPRPASSPVPSASPVPYSFEDIMKEREACQLAGLPTLFEDIALL